MGSAKILAVTAALSIAMLVSIAGPAEAGTQAFEREVSEVLKEVSVKIRLIDRLGADALGISVDVTGEKATLSGNVANAASRGLAEEVALSVEGIGSVESKLVEKEPAGPVAATEAAVRNASLELKVKSILLSEIGTNALKVDVEAEDGVISLRGKPDDPETARLAVRKVKAIKGVKRVVDLLG